MARTERIVEHRLDLFDLKDPVTHRRILELDGRNRKLIVRDELNTGAKHEIEIFFHLAELTTAKS